MTPARDPWGDLHSLSTADLMAALERYQFIDELGHPLRQCAEFIELARRAGVALDVAQPKEVERAE